MKTVNLQKEIFDTATAELGLDMTKLCFEENEQLDQTEYTQAAMVTACLAMTAEIEKRGLTPDVTAGLSLESTVRSVQREACSRKTPFLL